MSFAAWFEDNRRRTRAFFDTIVPEAYADRPIALRHPICFYEGHIAAFNVNTLLKRALGRSGVDAGLEDLFERGIDPEDERSVPRRGGVWPSRPEILAYAAAADLRVREALEARDLPLEPVYTILEHERIHQETLGYMWHRLPYDRKLPPPEPPAPPPGDPHRGTVRIPAGRATLGAAPGEIPFGWDNEHPLCVVDVDAFEIDVHSVTNGDFLEFVDAGGYRRPELWSREGWSWIDEQRIRHPLFWERDGDAWLWRGMWRRAPLQARGPVWVSHAEASAYARWKGRRLPTEAEFMRAAYGTPEGRERRHPWGDEPPDGTRGWFDFAGWDPAPAGAFPAGRSAFGVEDLIGNGWEWTSTIFGPFPGFRPMASYPQYSADFFDGKHWVMKGASPATARELIRPTFRNWFRGAYPYTYTKFRLCGATS
jgi:gamma-glutamyl hercynylcysteine S-oxide synthase